MQKIIRYSTQGFIPQRQTYHMDIVDYHLNRFDITDYPEHLRYAIQHLHDQSLPFYKEHYNDLQEGIWFFLEGYKNNQALNHLQKPVPCWEAYIEEDVDVYDCNWEMITSIHDPLIKFGGCYLPKRELCKVHDVKRRKSHKHQKKQKSN